MWGCWLLIQKAATSKQGSNKQGKKADELRQEGKNEIARTRTGRGCKLAHVGKLCFSGIAKSLFVRRLRLRSDCVRDGGVEDVVFEHQTATVRLRGCEAEAEFRTACFLRGWAVGLLRPFGTARL